MCAVSVGVDMLEIERMERICERRPRFLTRVFTDEERRYCESRPYPAQHYAARFAAREAVLKALGIGFENGIGFKDVSVILDEKGAPSIQLSGAAKARAQELGIAEIAVSLSHTRSFAVANAVVIQKEDIQKKDSVENERLREYYAYRQAREIVHDLARAVTDNYSEKIAVQNDPNLAEKRNQA